MLSENNFYNLREIIFSFYSNLNNRIIFLIWNAMRWGSNTSINVLIIFLFSQIWQNKTRKFLKNSNILWLRRMQCFVFNYNYLLFSRIKISYFNLFLLSNLLLVYQRNGSIVCFALFHFFYSFCTFLFVLHVNCNSPFLVFTLFFCSNYHYTNLITNHQK